MIEKDLMVPENGENGEMDEMMPPPREPVEPEPGPAPVPPTPDDILANREETELKSEDLINLAKEHGKEQAIRHSAEDLGDMDADEALDERVFPAGVADKEINEAKRAKDLQEAKRIYSQLSPEQQEELKEQMKEVMKSSPDFDEARFEQEWEGIKKPDPADENDPVTPEEIAENKEAVDVLSEIRKANEEFKETTKNMSLEDKREAAEGRLPFLLKKAQDWRVFCEKHPNARKTLKVMGYTILFSSMAFIFSVILGVAATAGSTAGKKQ